MNPKQQESRQALVTTIVADIDDTNRRELLLWAQELIEIRDSDLPAVVKARRALLASTRKAVVTATSKAIYERVKPYIKGARKHGWDDRGIAGRFTMGGIALGTTVFAGQGVGLAALGSAIGLPLWLVLGAGGALLGTLVEELSRKPISTEYTVIDAERVEAKGPSGSE